MNSDIFLLTRVAARCFLISPLDEQVSYYNQAKFLLLPQGFTDEKRVMLDDFIDYLEYKRIHRNAKKKEEVQ